MILRPIPGFPGYSVTDTGVVLSKSGRALRPSLAGRPARYERVKLRQNGRYHSRYVHQLVLLTFVGPRPVGFETRHLNGNPTDNNASNLTWGTRRENIADRGRHNGHTRGARNPGAKLTPAQVREIRRLCVHLKQKDVAAEFGVTPGCVSSIVSGRNWRHA